MNLQRSLFLVCGLAALSASPPSSAQGAEPSEAKKGTYYVIPHTHWEGAVFKTREEYLEMGLTHIVKAMRLLKEQPDYRFTLDQVAYFRPFLERYPEMVADFKKYIAEGRLQIAGALDVMPDVNVPGGETFVRQILYGKGYCREKLGLDVTTGWLIDTFGHHEQMPQLMTLGGYKTFWFFRGVPKMDHPAEFIWEGLDGTKIPAFWLAHSYAIMYPAPTEYPKFLEFSKASYNLLNPQARGVDRAGPSGADVCEPQEHLVPLANEFNAKGEAPFSIRVATPADFEAVIAKRGNLPTFKGELNPLFQGVYTSRIELKEWMRRLERQLLNVEKLGVLAGWLGAKVDRNAILEAWEPVLFNETHDLSSGVMTDHVYEDTIRSYEYVNRRSGELLDASWQAIASKVDTQGAGAPVVVFNSLGWTRSDLVEVDLGFEDGGVTGVVVTDDAGKSVPVQILKADRYGDGGLRTARVAFVAREIPALGYKTYHAAPSREVKTPATGPNASGENLLENEFYKLSVDPASGALTGLHVKEGGWEALSGHANVVSREVDRGDLWELDRGLDGASRIAMTSKQPVPKTGEAVFSNEKPGAKGTFGVGPVVSEFQIARPFSNGQFATNIRVIAGLRRVEFTTKLVNQEKYVHYRALFPTTIPGGKSIQEIPFGASERPEGIEFPAQNWVDHGDGKRGVALLNIGLPGHVVDNGTMMISLLRSHHLGGYGFGGGYEPGMSSESGFQIGQERTMRYAVVPHAGDWREAKVYREGLEFNHPLVVRKEEPHAGSLPKTWGLLAVANPNVVISALKPGKDGTAVLRLYEATGKASPGASVKFQTKVLAANEANLMEDLGAAVKVEGDTVSFDLRPFEIKTIVLKLAARE
ncbi:alpha-mannosidase [Singulisphaera sp. PoT]|uniref:alpha-mannosidase n=1 Tax=Singulisphaera sp. PoT TaxID=3411797 RepID=UPI003BF571FF